MPKKIAIIIFLSLGCWFQSTPADPPAVGLAIHNGPALLTAKFWMNQDNAIDVAGTFDFHEDRKYVYFHTDFLHHLTDIINLEEGRLPLYYGGGIKFSVGTENTIGIRTPLGASYIHKNTSFETFFEIAPFIDIIENARFSLHGAMGFRIYL